MSSEVLQGVETLAEEPVSFPQFSSLFTICIAAFPDALVKGAADERGGGIPTTVFGSHVVLSVVIESPHLHHELLTDLHTRVRVDFQLAWVDWGAKLGVT